LSTTVAQKRKYAKKTKQPPCGCGCRSPSFCGLYRGGLYSGYLFYATIREIVARAELPALPILQLPSFNLSGASASETIDETPPELPDEILNPGGSGECGIQPPPLLRSVLIGSTSCCSGIDRRSGKSWGSRTDTIHRHHGRFQPTRRRV